MDPKSKTVASFLIVDDDRSYLSSLLRGLKRSDIPDFLEITTTESGEHALNLIIENQFDIILTDLKMTPVDGRRVADLALKNNPEILILIMTGYSDLKDAVALIKRGIYDYLAKPFDISELILKLRRIIQVFRRKEELSLLRQELKRREENEIPLIYSGPAMKKVISITESVADTDFPILITGESGTGKELIADMLHRFSPRNGAPFIKINCAGLVSNLLESEFFGHEKGAFTGAIKEKKGKFELAHTGTLFLDEIGDMDLGIQAKFLRLLQQGEFQRVGGSETLHSDVRVIAATNRNLHDAMVKKEFREDLYFRLNAIEIEVPPLRERKQDIPLLVIHFLNKLGQKYQRFSSGVDSETMNALCEYSYPGNIRELENIVSRAYALSREKEITISVMPNQIATTAQDSEVQREQLPRTETMKPDLDISLEQQVAELEKSALIAALKKTSNNKIEAANILKISRRQFYYKLEKYQIT